MVALDTTSIVLDYPYEVNEHMNSVEDQEAELLRQPTLQEADPEPDPDPLLSYMLQELASAKAKSAGRTPATAPQAQ